MLGRDIQFSKKDWRPDYLHPAMWGFLSIKYSWKIGLCVFFHGDLGSTKGIRPARAFAYPSSGHRDVAG
tara:strand:- start:158 stop:364 length:207 start_codon:yes stop_codon:yes gene_type:complete